MCQRALSSEECGSAISTTSIAGRIVSGGRGGPATVPGLRHCAPWPRVRKCIPVEKVSASKRKLGKRLRTKIRPSAQ